MFPYCQGIALFAFVYFNCAYNNWCAKYDVYFYSLPFKKFTCTSNPISIYLLSDNNMHNLHTILGIKGYPNPRTKMKYIAYYQSLDVVAPLVFSGLIYTCSASWKVIRIWIALDRAFDRRGGACFNPLKPILVWRNTHCIACGCGVIVGCSSDD